MATYKKLKEKGYDDKLSLKAAEKYKGNMDKAIAFVKQGNIIKEMEHRIKAQQKKKKLTEVVFENAADFKLKKDGKIDKRSKAYKAIMRGNENKAKNKGKNKKPKK